MTTEAGIVGASGVGPGRARQNAIFRAGALGRAPSVPTDAPTLERRAKKVMSRTAWAYVAGGAGEGRTMRHNREAFERCGLAIAGADGVRQVIENIVAELDLTMGLLGVQSIKDLSRDLLLAINDDQRGEAAVSR